MPIYEYRCENGHTFEVMQRMTDDPVSRLRDLRGAGPARVPPRRRALQGQGLLQHRLRHEARNRELERSGKDGADKSSLVGLVVGVVRPRRRPRAARRRARARARATRRRRAPRRRPRRRRRTSARRYRRKRWTSACFSASETSRPAPPSGRRLDAARLEHLGRRRAARSPGRARSRAARAAHVRLDRLRRVPGDPRQAEERRRARTARHFIAARIFCWRRARVRSFSRGLQRVLARAGERERLLAVDVRRALRAGAACSRRSWQPPLIFETTQPPV